jgi:hypothetical protein
MIDSISEDVASFADSAISAKIWAEKDFSVA